MQAETNMMKNEIHNIVISLNNIKEAKIECMTKFTYRMSQLNREERIFIKKLSNL